jgi:hypothetical protein
MSALFAQSGLLIAAWKYIPSGLADQIASTGMVAAEDRRADDAVA